VTTDAKKDFFISFNRADRAWAEWVAWQLEEEGYTTLLQAWDFRPGGNFVLDMQRAAEGSERTLAVLSPDFLASEYTQPEWAAAFARDPTGEQQTLVPVRVRECRPTGLLAQVVYVELVGILDEAEARTELLKGVRKGRAKPERAPEFPAGARRSVESRPRFPGALPRVWNVPVSRNPNFTGREDLLAALSSALSSGRPAALTQAVHGLGGVGKTQLAAEYAYRHSHLYDVVWWVRSEEPAALASDYATLAARLGLAEADEADQRLVSRAVRDWLGRNPRWLLVLDNARTRSEVREYLPQGSTGHVIITSRDRDWSGLASPLQVREMPRDESVQFLLKRTSQHDSDAADKLADALGDLPLALEQAGAYIDATAQTLPAYLELFRQHHARLLARGATSTDYPDSVATTWDISFQEVRRQSPHSEPLINLLAFFAPDDIPLDIIVRGAQHLPAPLKTALTDPITLDEALLPLRRYSLIERDGNMISIHRLVQTAVRDRLNEDDKKTWAAAAVKLVNEAYPFDSDDVRTWPDCSRLLPHASTATEHATALEVGARPVSRLLNQLGLYLIGRAQYSQAKVTLEQAIPLGEIIFGKQSEEVATYFNNLGNLHYNQKDFNTAKSYHERSMVIIEAIHGKDSIQAAIRACNLGTVLRHLGDLKGAQAYLERALAIFEASDDADPIKTADALNSLGLVLHDQGDPAGALAILERALKMYETAYGDEHPDIANCGRNIGWMLINRGNTAEARAHLERALKTFQTYLGEDHPRTVNARMMLKWVSKDA